MPERKANEMSLAALRQFLPQYADSYAQIEPQQPVSAYSLPDMNFNLKTPGSLPRPEMRGGLGIPLGGGNLGINADYQGYGRGERPDYGGSISYKRQF